MALPSNFDIITVVGKYADFFGNPPPVAPVAGTVDFEPNTARIKHLATDLIIFGGKRTATLGSDGSFTIQLPITNDPDVTPSFQYHVSETIPGGTPARYDIEIPLSLLPGPVDLSDLIAIGTPPSGTTALTREVADTIYALKGSGGGGGSGASETSEATAGSLALRDGSGRTKFGTPIDPAHAATKQYVDGATQAVATALGQEIDGIGTQVSTLGQNMDNLGQRVGNLEETPGGSASFLVLGQGVSVPTGTPANVLILRTA